jgi:hypothetical protein
MIVPDLWLWPGCTCCPLRIAGRFFASGANENVDQGIAWRTLWRLCPRQDTSEHTPGLQMEIPRPVINVIKKKM